MPSYTYLPNGQKTYGHATCPSCGKEFEKTAFHQIYCSDTCRRRGNRLAEKLGRAVAPHMKGYKEQQIETVCVVCGKTFTAGNKVAKYCSAECRRIASMISRSEERKKETSKEIKIAFRTGRRGRPKQISCTMPEFYSEGKLWDINDPECKEVLALIRTFEPINWKAVYREQELERIEQLRREAEEPKTERGKYVRRNGCIKHGIK